MNKTHTEYLFKNANLFSGFIPFFRKSGQIHKLFDKTQLQTRCSQTPDCRTEIYLYNGIVFSLSRSFSQA